MSNNPAYDACVAGGTSPAVCAATFGGPDDGGDEGVTSLSQLANRQLFDLTRGGAPVKVKVIKLSGREGPGGYNLQDTASGDRYFASNRLLVDTLGFAYQVSPGGDVNTGNPIETRMLSQSERNAAVAAGIPLLGVPSAPSSTSTRGPAFRSTAAGLQAEQAFETSERIGGQEFTAEQAQANRDFQAEANRIAEEAALNRQRFSTIVDLIQGFLAEKAQARTTLANLPAGAFRFAAVKGGIAPFGTTPQGAFQKELTQLASAPVPQIAPNASAGALQGVIQQLTGVQTPQAPQAFGMAGGGMIPAPPPGQSVSVKVGERGEEVLRVTAEGVEVIPLSGGMQDGGTIGFPFSPVPFDRESLFPALGTSGVFSDFKSLPQVNRVAGQPLRIGSTQPFGPLGTLNRLGIRPRLLSPVGSRQVFYQDDEGRLQPINSVGAFQQAGFNPEDVVKVGQSSIEGFERGPAFTGRTFPTERPSPFTRYSTPVVEPTTGTLLPAPFMVASQMNQLRLTDPGAFNLLLSAYESAGVPGLSVLSTIQSALPFGAARGAVGLR